MKNKFEALFTNNNILIKSLNIEYFHTNNNLF